MEHQVVSLASLMRGTSLRFDNGGLRGARSELRNEIVCAYVIACLAHFKIVSHRVMISSDACPSSESFVKVCMATLQSLGLAPWYVGQLSATAFEHDCLSHKAPGIRVSADQTARDCHALKFYSYTGEISKTDQKSLAALNIAVPPMTSLLPYATQIPSDCVQGLKGDG